MSELTDFERAALRMLLNGEHQMLATLRRQLDTCRVVDREFTGAGFFTDLRCDTDRAGPPVLNIVLNDVHADFEGFPHGAGLLLFVEEGMLAMLEGFCWAEGWPDSMDKFELQYLSHIPAGPTAWSLVPALERDLAWIDRTLTLKSARDS